MTDHLVKTKVILPPGAPVELGPGWTTLFIREGSSDEDVLHEAWILDEMHLRGLDLREYALGEIWIEGTERSRVIDVGAHTGILAALVLRMFPRSEIICLEPDASNLELLHLNTQPFADRRTLIRGAIGADRGHVVLVGGNATGHTVPDDDGAAMDGGQRVEQVTLSDLIADKPVSLLKMDCEGAEYDAIAGAYRDKCLGLVDRIAMEIHGTEQAPWVDDAPRRYGEMMTQLAYTHSVQVFGRPDQGSHLFAHSYTL